MKVFTVHAAKTQFSKLIAWAQAGEEIVIAKGSTPVVKLVALDGAQRSARKFGAMKGKATVTAAFFDALPAAELDAWEG
ncbi:MAG: type II toxin-antitoxin system prevent-host-death family antitoxin [Gemmatimonadetes bacterium]|nr:type II toxin-antitoxin system prevent-host-death family antitoxin [Gemmatimonadota bacterium]